MAKRMMTRFDRGAFPTYETVEEDGYPQPCVMGQPWVNHDTQKITKSDPAHPLTSVPDPAAQTELENRQHLPQRTAFGRQHGADAKLDDSDSLPHRRLPRRFPVAAYLGEKTATESSGLRLHGAAAVAVDADR